MSAAGVQARFYASYGTVTEPCNHLQKFPHPQVLLLYYAQGSTALIETTLGRALFNCGAGRSITVIARARSLGDEGLSFVVGSNTRDESTEVRIVVDAPIEESLDYRKQHPNDHLRLDRLRARVLLAPRYRKCHTHQP